MNLLATFASQPALFVGVCVVLGLLVGSFLNVVIHRMPIMMERALRAECAELRAQDEAVRAAPPAADAAAALAPATLGAATAAEGTVEAGTGAPSASSADHATSEAAIPTEPAATPGVVETAPELADHLPETSVASADVTAAAPSSDALAAHETPYNLVVPRSACPHCNAPITALQNVPVVSWLALRGKCASCRAPISARYPIVELVTGVLTGFVAWHFGWGLQAAGAIVFTWFLIALTMIDFDTKYLPDQLTYPLLWLGLLMSLAHPVWSADAAPVSPRDSILGAVFGYLSLWSVYWLFKLLTGKEGMGYGDFKLLAALGAWLGWQMLLPIILLSSLTGSVIGIAILIRKRLGKDTEMPFGPYLAAAGWIALVFGHALVSQYFALTELLGS
jgi:leader peptidase (prepilin peptidase) / N-methyltransferase